MNELFGAVDETDDGNYLAVIVGTYHMIRKNSQLLPVHMSHSPYVLKIKKELVHTLDFNNDISVHCLKFGLPLLKDKIKKRRFSRKIRLPQDKINKKIAYEISRNIDTFFGPFSISYGIPVIDIEFEVDNLTIDNYLRIGGHTTTSAERAHKIADCVAYANHRGWKINKVVEHGKEFEEQFHNNILDKL